MTYSKPKTVFIVAVTFALSLLSPNSPAVYAGSYDKQPIRETTSIDEQRVQPNHLTAEQSRDIHDRQTLLLWAIGLAVALGLVGALGLLKRSLKRKNPPKK